MMKKEYDILLVEDNEGDVRIIKELLKEQSSISFKITVSGSLAESEKIIGKNQFDTILLDLGLPDSVGFETFDKLNKKNSNLNTIIILTGLDDTETGLKAVNQGAQDYIIKGTIDSEKLVKSIIYSFERSRLILALKSQLQETKVAEEARKESEEFTKQIIESSNDCIKVLDLEGNLLSMSTGGQKILEIDDISVYLNKSWIDFWKGKDREGALDAISEAKKGNMGIFTGYCETEKGTSKWWEIVITPIRNSDSNIFRLLAISRDITERKKSVDKIIEKTMELERFNNLMVNRELKMIDLKIEINDLLKRLGKKEKYLIAEDEDLLT